MIVSIEIEVPDEVADLAVWWLETAADDLIQGLPKIDEYGGKRSGSADLRVMGDSLAELLGWDNVPSSIAQQLACWHYLVGKTSRLISDFQQRREPKADTLHDATVYTMMMRRLSEAKTWP